MPHFYLDYLLASGDEIDVRPGLDGRLAERSGWKGVGYCKYHVLDMTCINPPCKDFDRRLLVCRGPWLHRGRTKPARLMLESQELTFVSSLRTSHNCCRAVTSNPDPQLSLVAHRQRIACRLPSRVYGMGSFVEIWVGGRSAQVCTQATKEASISGLG